MRAAIIPQRLALFLAALALALTSAAPAAAQWPTPPAKSSKAVLAAYKEVVAAPSQSTVRVYADGDPVALGTVVDADGWVITKATLVKGKLTVEFKGGKTASAKLVGIDVKHDLAMLRVAASGLKPVKWAHSKTAEVGHLLAAPGLGELPVAIGVVSVATRRPSAREMTMMSPSTTAGYLGVAFSAETRLPLIGQVMRGGPAAKGGLKSGDVILRVQGRVMADADRVIETIYGFKPGDVITLRVKREDEEMTLRVTLGRRPSDMMDRSDEMNRMGSRLSGRRGGFPVVLQHDAVIAPGDCGGPLVDLDGQAVGINIARAGRTESYAIPSEAVQALLSDLKSGKLAPPPVVNDDKIEQLEGELNKARAELRKANEAIDDTDDAQKKETLRERVGTLRKRINALQDELNKLRGDPTKPRDKKE